MTDHARPKSADAEVLCDAMWQLLDDMGKDGQSVCLAAKAQARIAYEPFRDRSEPEYDDWLSLEDAKAIMDEVEGKPAALRTATQPSPHSREWNAAIEAMRMIANGRDELNELLERSQMESIADNALAGLDALTRPIQQNEGEAKPVAWRWRGAPDEAWQLERAAPTVPDDEIEVEPLYTRPSPQQPEAQAGVNEVVDRLVTEAISVCEPENGDEKATAYTRSVLTKRFTALLPQAGKSDAGWMPIDTKTPFARCEERGIYTDKKGDGLFFFRATHWRPAPGGTDA